MTNPWRFWQYQDLGTWTLITQVWEPVPHFFVAIPSSIIKTWFYWCNLFKTAIITYIPIRSVSLWLCFGFWFVWPLRPYMRAGEIKVRKKNRESKKKILWLKTIFLFAKIQFFRACDEKTSMNWLSCKLDNLIFFYHYE